jgi:predicted phosphodiesterase
MEARVKALVVSDLHSNAEALRAVFGHMRRKRYDEVFCLGDFVGYGAQPNQVLDVMRTLRPAKLYIRGNHDRVAAGIDQGDGFNYAARHAALWTRDKLSGPNRDFLLKLPVGPLVHGNVMLCHGSPDDEDEYVFNEHHARMVFARHDAPVIFYGHTHLPVVFAIDRDERISGYSVRTDAIVKLDPKLRYLINPGSVGQPRDRNPRAACVLYDARKATVQFIRVAYDIEKTQDSILRAGLPRVLADRLAVGS